MPGPLVVNPFLVMQPVDAAGAKCDLVGPKPGEGLRTLTISKAESPELFEVFSDLSTSSFDFLDPELDLQPEDRQTLLESGVLLPRETAPEMPLFSCELRDVTPYGGTIDRDSLVVHPQLRFEPFDL